MDKITIITVCLNSENVIRKTIESVLNQNYHNIEYILKDGMSSDSTMMIIQEYKEQFMNKGITYTVVSAADTSLYDAMNIAIDMANGNWINFLNAGDCLADENVLTDIFQNKTYNEDVLFGDNYVEDMYGRYLNISDMSQISQKMPFNHQAAFFRAGLVKERPYDLDAGIGADYDMIMEFYKSNKTFLHLSRIVSIYDLEGITSRKYVLTAKSRRNIRKKYGYTDNIVIDRFKILEAYLKEYIELFCPQNIQKALKHIYKKYVKHYQGDL